MADITSRIRSFCRVPGALTAAALALALCRPLAAQIIPVRVVPIAEVDQFEFFPSSNFGMANVSIALADSLLDPYHNPALGARMRRGWYFGAPTFFSVTNDAGSGETYPIGGMARRGRTFGGGVLAIQEITPGRPRQSPFFGGIAALDLTTAPLPPVFAAEPNEPAHNRHAQAFAGHTFGSSLTLAASGMWSDLRAMEGMELLFTGSHNVLQRGNQLDLRFGLLREWGTRSLEAVVVRRQLDMAYDVGYTEPYWDPATRQRRLRTSVEHANDGALVNGAQIRYRTALRDSGWTAGALLTVNHRRDENAPYYEFMGIPRDASRTFISNLGLGVSRQRHQVRMALDVVFEPAWRNGRGSVDSTTLAGTRIWVPGETASESYFRFTNIVLRGGIARDILMAGTDNRLRLQFGTQLRNVNYALEEHDFLTSVFRERRQSWREWTHAWGTNFIFPQFEFAYQLRLLSGMGRLGVPPMSDDVIGVPDILFPGSPPQPASATTMYPVRVASHQIFFSVPIR